MMHTVRCTAALAGLALATFACVAQKDTSTVTSDSTRDSTAVAATIADRIAKYTTVPLVADTTALTPKERQMIPLLIQAAQAMDPIYWMQTYGSRDSLLATVTDSALGKFIDINYGSWDRLDNNAPFVPGVGTRPPGGNLYPK